jgi:glycosyltransferase involved in cell wall biosynthesis
MRPISIPAKIREHCQPNDVLMTKMDELNQRFSHLLKGEPEVSIVMPAYNEEENILRTLSSLSRTATHRSVEFIIVDNNSKDRTADLVRATGVICVRETQQGITPARNCGLRHARGKYVLNADADTIYPPDWLEQMVKPLEDPSNAACYGRFSFIPIGKTTRFTYFFYEYMADYIRYYNRYFREEAVNVYGFNSSFRRTQGLEVEGFNHPPSANEDGYLALKLRDKGFGKLFYVTSTKALVWTTDRRLQIDGGLWSSIRKKARRVLLRK